MCEPIMLNITMALFFVFLSGISAGTIFTCWMINKLEDNHNGR